MSSSVFGMADAFDNNVETWLEYVESTSGRLRDAEILHHLQEHLPTRSLQVLDAGGGTGQHSACLARQSHVVTLLDFSPTMLARARRTCRGLSVAYVCSDISQIEVLFEPASFDLVLCHSLLEFTSDVQGVIAALERLLRAQGLLSVVVGNRYHAPLRQAILQRDFARARRGLDGEMPDADLFGLPKRTFYPESVRQTLERCGLSVAGEYGIRVFSDLIPDLPGDVDDLITLELAAGSQMPYRHIARFIQFIATRA